MSAAPGHDGAAPAVTRSLANAIYGTIIAAGVLAATGPDEDPRALETALYVVATAGVLWIAHAWSHTIAAQVAGAAPAEHGLAHALRAAAALALAALPPAATLALVRLLGGGDELAIEVATWLCVGLLCGAGGLVARRHRVGPLQAAALVVGTGALGALLVALKTLVH